MPNTCTYTKTGGVWVVVDHCNLGFSCPSMGPTSMTNAQFAQFLRDLLAANPGLQLDVMPDDVATAATGTSQELDCIPTPIGGGDGGGMGG